MSSLPLAHSELPRPSYTEKRCTECCLVKPVTDFHNCRQGNTLGYVSKCKECLTKARRTPEYREKHKAYCAKWRTENPDKATAVNREWRQRNREKQRAHCAVYAKKRRGTLVPQPCVDCGSTAAHAHHEDYEKRFDVTWLCVECHERRHHG